MKLQARELKWGLSVNKWRDVKCSDVGWTDVIYVKLLCIEVKWSDVKCSDVEWTDVIYVKWFFLSEMKWSELRWSFWGQKYHVP